ncbi:MAG: MBL fold metallo-hydrolase [Candidatus Tectomicrobia bacterium]|uniref:MBL fold metallo-hydrolase n=1 Tax=Tectimicrobiota bacterium TaxID=2528274 RepID=A0A932CNZ8_UNCTE|nr:MBL fold metallo-hydrolase [Candidatus Tectomicrobia bacterium]
MASSALSIKFWGVRGSLAAPGPYACRYGGNTSCVEIRLPDGQRLIFDAGSGIRELGHSLSDGGERLKAHIFITHYHWDHIQGFPFFMPAYHQENQLVILGPKNPQRGIEQIMATLMESVFFPVSFHEMGAEIQCQELVAGGDYPFGEAIVQTALMNHPGSALGYSLLCNGLKIVYISDNELVPRTWQGRDEKPFPYEVDQREAVAHFVRGADLLIHDAQYTDEDYEDRVGWGHSSWGETLQLAIENEVKNLAFYHFDPDYSDHLLDQMMTRCWSKVRHSGISLNCFAARENMEIPF